MARLRRRAAHAEGALRRVGQRVGAVEGCLAQLASSATRLQHGAATVRQALGEAVQQQQQQQAAGSLREAWTDGPNGDAALADAGLAAALAAALAATDLLVADTAAAAAEGASAMNDAFVAGQRAAERECIAASAARGEMGGVGGGGGNLGGGGVVGGADDGGGSCGGGGSDGSGGSGGSGGSDGSGGSGGGESNGAAAAVEGRQSTWREASGRVQGSRDAYQIGDATRSALRWVAGVRGSGSS